jgi:hypothetical protein
MRFRKHGNTYQLRVDAPDDLAAVLQLDESLWVATSAPVSAFRCDPRFLELIDVGGSGRIHLAEVKQAIAWLLRILADTSRLGAEVSLLPLSGIQAGDPVGQALLDSARYVLKTLGDSTEDISCEQVRRFLNDLQKQPLNGDGVIVPGSASDSELAVFIQDAVIATGGTQDAGGEQGVTREQIDQFVADAAAYLKWQDRLGNLSDGSPTQLLPLGSETPELFDLYSLHADKVDEFFGLCRIARFAPEKVSDALFRAALPDALAGGRESTHACLEACPLAAIGPDAVLPLGADAVNPEYEAWLQKLGQRVLPGLLGNAVTELVEEDWLRVKSAFAPYGQYVADKKGSSVEKIPVDRLRRCISGELPARAHALTEQDQHVTRILKDVLELERLLLYHQNLMRLANNFVNFSQLYSLSEIALFEMGALVMDGRWFNFAVNVEDVKEHEKLARTSNIFTLYLEITENAGGKKYHVAVPATSGSRGNLVVGKRGVFFDIHGKPCDARVTRIIENPISIREALAAPFVRLWQFVIGKIEAISTSSEKGLQKQTGAILQASSPAPAETPVAGQAAGGRAGLLVGLSLSAAAIGSSFAFITKTLAGLTYWQVLGGLLGAVAAVGIPVSLIAILKLRRQDLSSLLEGCGWAINARMRPDRAQRHQFTRHVPYPRGAEGLPKRRWSDYVLLVLTFVAAVAAVCRIASVL